MMLSNSPASFHCNQQIPSAFCFCGWDSSSNPYFRLLQLYLMSAFHSNLYDLSLEFYIHSSLPFPSLLPPFIPPFSSILSTYVANSWTVKHVKKSGPRRISIEDPALTQSYPHALSVLKAWQLSQFLSSDLHLRSETFFSLSHHQTISN